MGLELLFEGKSWGLREDWSPWAESTRISVSERKESSSDDSSSDTSLPLYSGSNKDAVLETKASGIATSCPTGPEHSLPLSLGRPSSKTNRFPVLFKGFFRISHDEFSRIVM